MAISRKHAHRKADVSHKDCGLHLSLTLQFWGYWEMLRKSTESKLSLYLLYYLNNSPITIFAMMREYPVLRVKGVLLCFEKETSMVNQCGEVIKVLDWHKEFFHWATEIRCVAFDQLFFLAQSTWRRGSTEYAILSPCTNGTVSKNQSMSQSIKQIKDQCLQDLGKIYGDHRQQNCQ